MCNSCCRRIDQLANLVLISPVAPLQFFAMWNSWNGRTTIPAPSLTAHVCAIRNKHLHNLAELTFVCTWKLLQSFFPEEMFRKFCFVVWEPLCLEQTSGRFFPKVIVNLIAINWEINYLTRQMAFQSLHELDESFLRCTHAKQKLFA